MAMTEQVEDNAEKELLTTQFGLEYDVVRKTEFAAIRAIAEANSSNKLFYVRLKPEDIDKIKVGEKVIVVVEEEYRNYILVFSDSDEPIPDDDYFQALMIEHGKVIVENTTTVL